MLPSAVRGSRRDMPRYRPTSRSDMVVDTRELYADASEVKTLESVGKRRSGDPENRELRGKESSKVGGILQKIGKRHTEKWKTGVQSALDQEIRKHVYWER